MAERRLFQNSPQAIKIVESANGLVAPRAAAVIGPISAYIAFVIELTLVPLLLPAINSQFDLSAGNLAWVFNAYSAAVAVGVVLCALCGDAYSVKRIFGFGVSLFAAGSLLSAATQSYEALIVGRILQGFGSGVFSPLLPILLTRASPLAPGRALILWGSIAGYVAAIAPLLYGIFLGPHSWRLAFVLIAIIAFIALVLLNGFDVPDDPEPSTKRQRNYSEILRSRDLLMTFAYVFCTYGCITFYLFKLPVWLSENEHDTFNIGFVLSMVWLTFSGFSILLRNWVDRHYIQVIMFVAPLLIASGLLLLYTHQSLLLISLSAILVAAGLASSNAPSTQLILRLAPVGMSAVSASLDITFARLGGIATVSILAGANEGHASIAICFLCLVAAVCAMSVSQRCVNSS